MTTQIVKDETRQGVQLVRCKLGRQKAQKTVTLQYVKLEEKVLLDSKQGLLQKPHFFLKMTMYQKNTQRETLGWGLHSHPINGNSLGTSGLV